MPFRLTEKGKWFFAIAAISLIVCGSVVDAKQFTRDDHVYGLSLGLARRVLMYDEDELNHQEKMAYIARMKLMAIQLIEVIESGEKESPRTTHVPGPHGIDEKDIVGRMTVTGGAK